MRTGDIFSISEPSVATIGFFDGVHKGHQFLLSQLKDASTQRSLKSTIVTFANHPRCVTDSGFKPRLLTTSSEKICRLEHSAIDNCIMLNFTEELSLFSAYEFMKMLKSRAHVEALVIGYDHRFGHNRSEGFSDYLRYGKELNMEVILAEPYTETVCPGGDIVSSSCIRKLLSNGDIINANACLGYRYSLEGQVVSGFHIGTHIGFPTANIRPDEIKLLPSDGVYAVFVYVGDDCYQGMLNIGNRPTFANGSKEKSIEVHILHFNGDVYGSTLRLEFVDRIRDEQKFDSPASLAAQLHEDAVAVSRILK